jgi:outer membrane protein assembly factor BamB
MQSAVAIVSLAFFLARLSASASDWPNWRGPDSSGSTADAATTVSWDPTNNVIWRVPLPEPGNSSPIVTRNRVFVTQPIGKRRAVVCVDRATGARLWEAGPVYEKPEETMKENNPYCSASPVTDGERVLAFFGSAGLYCFDLAGHELWHADLGSISHPFGTASSPVLSGENCFVYVGPGDKEQSMVAVNKRTGKVVWRSEALKPSPAEAAKISSNGPPVGSWSTPLVIHVDGSDQLVMPFAFRFGAYRPADGKLLWQSGGLGLQTYVTPSWTDGLLVVMSGTTALAVRPSKNAAPEPQIVWSQERGKFRFGSGVSTERHLYFLSENGLAECWDKMTGKVLWQERLAGPGKKRTTWSSLSKAGDRIFAPNQSGDVFTFAASPTFTPISTNSVAEPTNASLAHSDGQVFMRTEQALWCFGKKKKEG